MISSIFGKTKPVNFVIVIGFVFGLYWLVNLILFKQTLEFSDLIYSLFVIGVLCFSIFVIDFIVKRNQITGTNSFTILFFALLTIIFPEVLQDSDAIFCTFFLLLAFRRIISLKSLKSIKLKIFDATFWILIASFWVDWALLFMVLVFLAIYFYEPKVFKNWLVPFVATFIVFTITLATLILFNEVDTLEAHYRFNWITTSGNWTSYTKLIVYSLFALGITSVTFIKMSKLGMGKIITMRLIAIALVLGLGITFLKFSEMSSVVLVTFFSTSVFLTKYIELIKKANFKELFLIASIVLPFIIFGLEVILK